jgi:hypothetical protein
MEESEQTEMAALVERSVEPVSAVVLIPRAPISKREWRSVRRLQRLAECILHTTLVHSDARRLIFETSSQP